MKWSIRIATIAGTEVRIHLTFPILLLWIGTAAFMSGGALQAVASLVFVCALFFCVVLHEFGHVTAARAFGIRTPDITLLPIGGLARMESLPEKPAHEFLIAIAGPIVNVVIFLLLLVPLSSSMPQDIDPGKLNFALILPLLATVNLWLAVFNMIPAFPMDGGRILRALLAMTMNYERATSIAAHVGQALAIAGGTFGLLIGHPILVLIAVFIFFGAAAENAATQFKAETQDLPVRDAMMTHFATLLETATIKDAAESLLAGPQRDFPVVDANGSLVGILHQTDIVSALAKDGPKSLVGGHARPCAGAILESAKVSDAILALQASGCSAVPVVDRDHRQLLGMVTGENISELLMIIHADSERARREAGEDFVPLDRSSPLKIPGHAADRTT